MKTHFTLQTVFLPVQHFGSVFLAFSIVCNVSASPPGSSEWTAKLLSISEKWRAGDHGTYYSEMLKAVEAITNRTTDEETQALVLPSALENLLSKEDDSSKDTDRINAQGFAVKVKALQLVCARPLMGRGLEPVAYAECRRRLSNAVIGFFQTIQNDCIPNYQTEDAHSDYSEITKAMGPNDPFLWGMRPGDIKNVKLREAYEKELERVRVAKVKNNMQVALQRAIPTLKPRILEFIVKLYSMPPRNDDEALKYLGKIQMTEEERSAALEAIKRRIQPDQR